MYLGRFADSGKGIGSLFSSYFYSGGGSSCKRSKVRP